MLNKGLLGALGVVAVLATSCGTESQANDPAVAEGKADGGGYFFDRVSYVREVLAPDVAGQPTTLKEALPCEQGEGLLSTSVAIRGKVAAAKPGDGIVWGEEEDQITLTDFDDPKADERDVILEIAVDQASMAEGVEAPKGTAKVRVGVLAGADPERFRASLASAGDVFVLLSTIPDGNHEGEFYPALGGAGIGLVDATTGEVTFPGLGESQAKFRGELKTAEAALAIC